jgi:hypothetical protein
MLWPEVVELNDITVGPMLAGNSKSKMALAADPPSPLLGHFRYGRPISFVDILPLDHAEAAVGRVVEEPTIYGGPLFRHFGHALCESIHRLWPRFALKELHGAKVAFNLVNNTKIMPYVTEALNLHGFSKVDVIPIDEPILFKRLFVGPQARQMAGPTLIPNYRAMLDRELAWRLPPDGGQRRLYISRLRHHHTGSYYGETFVQSALAEEGFEAIYPEDHSLNELVTLLRSCSLAVFAEGSAIHALELCGSAVPAVAVISRRQNSRERFEPLLSDICGNWMVSERLLMTAGLARDTKKHSGVVDLPALMRDLRSFANLSQDYDQRRNEMLAGVAEDVERHIHDARNDFSPEFGTQSEKLRTAVRKILSIDGRQAA